MEQWKDIQSYEGLYQVSSLGNVKGLDRYVKSKNGKQFKKGMVKKKSKVKKDKFKYHNVKLWKNGVIKTFNIHRLVAIAFIPNPLNKRTVNHINGIKTDNRVENLEWVTHSENTQHAMKIGLITGDYSNKPVLMLSLNNEPLKVFKSITEAKKQLNKKHIHISACCKGTRKTTGGYKWKYI